MDEVCRLVLGLNSPKEFCVQKGNFQSVKDLLDLINRPATESKQKSIFWVTDGVFLTKSGKGDNYALPIGRDLEFKPFWGVHFGEDVSFQVIIYARTQGEASGFFASLGNLPHNSCATITISALGTSRFPRVCCPSLPSGLFLRKESLCFSGLVFSNEQLKTLALAGRNGPSLEFTNGCEFENGGAEFVKFFRHAEDHTHYSIVIRGGHRRQIPFSSSQFASLLGTKNKLLKLSLASLSLDSECCSCLSKPQCLEEISLAAVVFEDNGSSLLGAMKEGRGPRKLSLDGINCFSSAGLGWDTFLDTLSQGGCQLRDLTIASYIGWRGSHSFIRPDLCQALRSNTSLEYLVLRVGGSCHEGLMDLLDAVSNHATLKSLEWEPPYIVCPSLSCQDMVRNTTRVATMLRANKQLEEIRIRRDFHCANFDGKEWAKRVALHLACNIHRKQSKCIRQGRLPLEFLLAQALCRYRGNPSFLWILMSQEQETLSKHLASF